jgi:hypothetical protein
MNTRPLEMISDTQPIAPIEKDTDRLQEDGFSEDEITSLLWLQQWYQHGGSDRIEVLRHLEFLKFQIENGGIES